MLMKNLKRLWNLKMYFPGLEKSVDFRKKWLRLWKTHGVSFSVDPNISCCLKTGNTHCHQA